MSRRFAAAIVGVGESGLGVAGDKTVLQLQAAASTIALAEAGLSMRDVDGLLTASNDLTPFASMYLAEYLGIAPSYTDTTHIGGASFEAHVGHASAALAAGLCSVVLIAYGSTQRSSRTRKLGLVGPVRYPEQFERIWGLPFPIGSYALAARRHMHEYGTTPEQLAEVAVAARLWAAKNPRAFAREPLSVADVLASPMISDPLHQLDCCLVTDGGGALVLTSVGRARDLAKRPVLVLGHGEAHTHANVSSMPNLAVHQAAIDSAGRAFSMAGLRASEMDVVELYDSFTITVLMTLEALGFCKAGEGGEFVADGRTRPGGSLPLNTNGGGLSYCHPGMYGIFQLVEAVRQLRGEANEAQVPDARLSVVHGTGGLLSSGATVILGVE